PDPTRTTIATEPMTQEAINNLITQRVAEALAEYETQRDSVVNGDTSNTTGTRPRRIVKGTDITSYTLRFQELTLLCGKMFLEESGEIESLTILRGTNKTNNHLEGTTMLHRPMLQSLEKNHTKEPNLCALNATSTMIDHVIPNAPTARGLSI
nr:hypothetical protein [Tanacetum cinerariifolium]